MAVEFDRFFLSLTPQERKAFSRRSDYAASYIRIHFVCPSFRRRIPSGAGFARLVEACDYYYRRGYDAPDHHALFAYFFRTASRSTRKRSRTVAAEV